MITTHDPKTVFIHFDSIFNDPWGIGEDGAAPTATAQHLNRVQWYCEWAAYGGRNVAVLLPKPLESQATALLSKLGATTPIWYTDVGAPSLPDLRRRGQILVINGNELPILDWAAVRSAARRATCDVLMFGPPSLGPASYYPESVLVDGSGKVVTFRRHYFDSPAFTDRWSGQASFLMVANEHAAAVISHVLVRGWGLESIGALTRRFSVRWSSESCVLSEAGSDLELIENLDLDGLGAMLPESWPRASRLDRVLEREPTPTHPRRYPDETGDTGLSGRGGAATVALRDSGTAGPMGRGTTRGGDAESIDDMSATQPDAVTPESGVRRPTVREAVAGNHRIYRVVKRVMDIALSGLGLIVLAPLLLIVGLLVKGTSRGPVLFGHRRQGLGGREFHCMKFRSMIYGADARQAELHSLNEVDGPQFKISSDPRLTRVGRWIRRHNIDELPQLWNVLVGEMSLVGPRPSPDHENQLCPAWRRARLSAKPGITGLWQVLRLRSEPCSDFQEWIYYDVEYARHRSLWLDLQILLHTPVAMFAPQRIARFAQRLRQRDICAHAAEFHAPLDNDAFKTTS